MISQKNHDIMLWICELNSLTLKLIKQSLTHQMEWLVTQTFIIIWPTLYAAAVAYALNNMLSHKHK